VGCVKLLLLLLGLLLSSSLNNSSAETFIQSFNNPPYQYLGFVGSARGALR
jgi:hypothetical protein